MPVVVRWYDDQQDIIYMHFPPQWTWDDLLATYPLTRDMLDSAEHTIFFIVDLRDAPLLPRGAFDIARMYNDSWHPNAGHAVLVGNLSILRGFVGVLRRLGLKVASMIEFADTPEEAADLLAVKYT